MNWGTSFVPGLIVMGVGLVVALLLALRLRRASTSSKKDLDLEIEDLQMRRDEIYRKLREEDGELLDVEERAQLEMAAARTLKRLDELQPAVPKTERRGGGTAKSTPQAAPQPARAGVTGFALGVGMASLIAVLLFWASGDATPRPPETPVAAAPDDETHNQLQQMSPEGRARAASLTARLEANPRDLPARKALTETFVMEGFFVEAFEQTETILADSPGDVDALYFQGLVRLTMGQGDQALVLLDRALTTQPDFVSARLVRGITRLRAEDREGAIEDWRAGLQAAGGAHPGLEQLLRLAESGASMEEILSAPPGPSRPPPASMTPAGTPIPEIAGDPYRLRLEVAEGVPLPATGVLFVSLRGDFPGPPAAVKRIDAPSFPLEIELDERDSMLGRPLPAKGTLSARVDQDGSATTREPGDLAAEIEISRGDSVTLQLTPIPD